MTKFPMAFLAAWLLVVATPADASSLGVEPVSLDIAAPRKTSTLTLRNEGDDAVATQIRIFRWTRNGGEDELVPTKDVVASPPAARLKPNSKYTVRIVRVTVTAINGNACTVSTTAVDFGSRGVLSSNVDVTGAVKVLCTSGLPYKISLGSGSSGAIATRKMASGSSALSYNLYSDSTRTTVWGTQTVTGSGTGSTLTHTVYARLPAQTTPKPGSYTDSVIVTVDY